MSLHYLYTMLLHYTFHIRPFFFGSIWNAPLRQHVLKIEKRREQAPALRHVIPLRIVGSGFCPIVRGHPRAMLAADASVGKVENLFYRGETIFSFRISSFQPNSDFS